MSGSRAERFLAFSTAVTAHTAYELQGTGQLAEYLATADAAAGRAVVDRLLDAWCSVSGLEPEARTGWLRRCVFGDPMLGPVARNVVKMWFLGVWYELPPAWTDAYGAGTRDVTRTVSATAYVESLVWPDIGANPPGAKAPGWGSWASPPRIPPVG